jgi:hypothetical protein
MNQAGFRVKLRILCFHSRPEKKAPVIPVVGGKFQDAVAHHVLQLAAVQHPSPPPGWPAGCVR